MNLQHTENYDQEDQNFQDEEIKFNTSDGTADHSITDNAEPDYGDDLVVDEFDNPRDDEFDEDDDEFDEEDLDDDEVGNEDLDDDDDDLNLEDEDGTNPNRYL